MNSDIPETQPTPKPKLPVILKFAIISSTISLLCCIASIFLCRNRVMTLGITVILFYMALFLGYISGILYLSAIAIAKGRRLLLFGFAFTSFLILMFFGSMALNNIHKQPYPAVCRSNLKAIKTSILMYSENHNNLLPDPNWCDKLLSIDTHLNQRNFVCKETAARLGQSSYAINKNLVGRKLSEANPDTVMIFETNPGWNLIGDANTISLNHADGCNVLFVNGKIRFIEKDKIPTLRWNP